MKFHCYLIEKTGPSFLDIKEKLRFGDYNPGKKEFDSVNKKFKFESHGPNEMEKIKNKASNKELITIYEMLKSSEMENALRVIYVELYNRYKNFK